MYPILDIVISRRSSLSIYDSYPAQSQAAPPPTLARSRTYTPPPHPIHPIELHVYLIDKFSVYNLKMANIYGRKM
jgi:hypothetical protein